MKDDYNKEFVLSFLRNGGLQVQPITEMSTHKTPDLRVLMPEGNLLIEVKSKNDDQQLRKFLKSPKGTVLSYKASLLETCLRDAWRQIRRFPEREDANFTVVWFITHKRGAVTIITGSVVMGLLYGTQLLEGYKVEREEFYEKVCFFFNESFFFKHKNLDGVVLHDDQSIKLCLNTFSPRYSSFKHTGFFDLFQEHFAVIDPGEIEVANECFIADCSITRKDKQGIVLYLKSKYGLDTVTIPIFSFFNLIDQRPG